MAENVVNTQVQGALTRWAQRKDHQTFSEVLRWAMQGQLLLDITDSRIANPQLGFQPGDTLSIAAQPDNAGKNLLLAFTDNDELARYRGRPGTSLVQPAGAVLAQAAQDFEGIVIDGRSAGAFIAYAGEIVQGSDGKPDSLGRLAEATVTRSLPFSEYLDALREGPLFIPFDVQRDAAGSETGIVVPGVSGPDGARFAVAGTSPAEIWAWSPGSGAQRTGLDNVVRALLEDHQSGLVINPAGPAVTIPAPILAEVISR
ncbi:SseB family protein [Psychromicrobium xiongbiense]|uniref:SseB family protein n=1 Tax=Psychromicrobium xiongbiense TaxID=3051184 RepID=UPI002554BC8B|nr:SseB family protein [Psychromicrobium sp. YIM S02556]